VIPTYLPTHIHTYTSTYPPNHPPTHLSTYLHTHHTYLPTYLPTYTSTELRTHPPTYTPILPTYPHTHLQNYVPTHLLTHPSYLPACLPWVTELVCQWVKQQLGLSFLSGCFENLGIFREPRARRTSAVGSRYRATATEHMTVDTSACMCVCETQWTVNCSHALDQIVQWTRSSIKNPPTVTPYTWQ
jgi:hypothetical protein